MINNILYQQLEERNVLIKAAAELQCESLQLITCDKEEQIEINQLTVQLTPAYKWLTETT